MRRPAIINVMLRATSAAARVLNKDFGEVVNLQSARGGPGKFANMAFKRATTVLSETLTDLRDDYQIFHATAGTTQPQDTGFIINALDGRGNFLHGVPHFAVTVAAIENGEITAAIIHDATRQDSFWATKGIGCYRENERLRVSLRRDLHDCLIGVSHLPFDFGEGSIGTVRAYGCAALDLAYVACGRLDGCHIYTKQNIAAGEFLVREAGGLVAKSSTSNKTDQRHDSIIASNAEIHDSLRATAKKA
ncbi:MAG: inositol monophosphatase [Pseudomonadota bacterium]